MVTSHFVLAQFGFTQGLSSLDMVRRDGMLRRFAYRFALIAVVTLTSAAAGKTRQGTGAAGGAVGPANFSPAPPQAAPPQIDAIGAEAQVWLSDLVKINTSTAAGEAEAAKYVVQILQKE